MRTGNEFGVRHNHRQKDRQFKSGLNGQTPYKIDSADRQIDSIANGQIYATSVGLCLIDCKLINGEEFLFKGGIKQVFSCLIV